MHENSNERHKNTVIIDLLVSAGEAAGVGAAGSATEQHLVRPRGDSQAKCFMDSLGGSEGRGQQPLVVLH